MPDHLDAIFFDVGNTLLFPNREIIYAPLHQRNLFPTSQQLSALECRTKNEFDALLEHGRADHSFWYMFYTRFVDELGVNDASLRDELVRATQVSANWACMRPGTREALERLRKIYRIGVISNADGKIRELLRANGIEDCFLSITDSGTIGCEKPAPFIFETALRDMHADARRSLYLGDMYSVDYLGATRAGMQAVLFDVCGAYKKKGVPRVESLEEFEQLLAASERS
ncbi:MAG: HAD family hydrolase [Acidobacteriales bacterium]|nr:HAD family hydrolase [Terriglobales bacterium]